MSHPAHAVLDVNWWRIKKHWIGVPLVAWRSHSAWNSELQRQTFNSYLICTCICYYCKCCNLIGYATRYLFVKSSNVRLYYPYWQYTDLFIFRPFYFYFVYFKLCLLWVEPASPFGKWCARNIWKVAYTLCRR